MLAAMLQSCRQEGLADCHMRPLNTDAVDVGGAVDHHDRLFLHMNTIPLFLVPVHQQTQLNVTRMGSSKLKKWSPLPAGSTAWHWRSGGIACAGPKDTEDIPVSYITSQG